MRTIQWSAGVLLGTVLGCGLSPEVSDVGAPGRGEQVEEHFIPALPTGDLGNASVLGCELPDYEAGRPVAATPGAWTFVPFHDAHCIDGSTTGMAINPHPDGGTKNLMIFMQGGGACFEPVSCRFSQGVHPFGPSDLEDAILTKDGCGLWDRDDRDNPLRDFHFVFIPYCTGDAHAGAMTTDEYTFSGYSNMSAYLKRIVATFPDVDNVLLAGSSAGGIGAVLNYEKVQAAFRCTPVHLLSDSGAIFGDAYVKPCLQQQWRTMWGLDSRLPADCQECFQPEGGGLSNYLPYLARTYPERRFALLLSDADLILKAFFGYGYLSSCSLPWLMPQRQYERGYEDLVGRMSALDNFRVFVRRGDDHPLLVVPPADTESGGVGLHHWLEDFWLGRSTWEHVWPQKRWWD